MSIVELRQHVRGHITLDKWDIFQNLARITPEALSQGTVIPQGDPITLPNTADVRDMESSSTEGLEAHNIPPHHLDIHPRRRPHQLNISPCLLRLMLSILCLALQELCWREMPWSFQPNMMWKSQRTCQPVRPLALLRWKLKLIPPLDQWSSYPAPLPHLTRLKRKDGACWLWLYQWGGWIWKQLELPLETCDCLSWKSNLWEPLNGGSPPRTH